MADPLVNTEQVRGLAELNDAAERLHQVVSAKFDVAAKAAAEAKRSKREVVSDSQWSIRPVWVPAAITTRRSD